MSMSFQPALVLDIHGFPLPPPPFDKGPDDPSHDEINQQICKFLDDGGKIQYLDFGLKAEDRVFGGTRQVANGRRAKPLLATNIKTGAKLFFASTTEAEKHGYKRGGVYMCTCGSIESYKGYRWEYTK